MGDIEYPIEISHEVLGLLAFDRIVVQLDGKQATVAVDANKRSIQGIDCETIRWKFVHFSVPCTETGPRGLFLSQPYSGFAIVD